MDYPANIENSFTYETVKSNQPGYVEYYPTLPWLIERAANGSI